MGQVTGIGGSLNRMSAVFLRYLYLHRRSLPRVFEIVFWPVMELFVWGFVAVYLKELSGDTLAVVARSLIASMIFWDILYRSQQGISIAFVEDIWTQNIINILISPLKIWEWILATFLYGVTKTAVITLILAGLAALLYHFNLAGSLHLYLAPLAVNLLLFGCVLGVVTSALVIRFGHAAEALIWGIPFLIQPLSAIFYPLSVLPVWAQWISRLLPSTYVFEGMRAVIRDGAMPVAYLWIGLGLNMIYLIFAGIFFMRMYTIARKTGRLGRLGLD